MSIQGFEPCTCFSGHKLSTEQLERYITTHFTNQSPLWGFLRETSGILADEPAGLVRDESSTQTDTHDMSEPWTCPAGVHSPPHWEHAIHTLLGLFAALIHPLQCDTYKKTSDKVPILSLPAAVTSHTLTHPLKTLWRLPKPVMTPRFSTCPQCGLSVVRVLIILISSVLRSWRLGNLTGALLGRTMCAHM
jgi:hypothetical protein